MAIVTIYVEPFGRKYIVPTFYNWWNELKAHIESTFNFEWKDVTFIISYKKGGLIVNRPLQEDSPMPDRRRNATIHVFPLQKKV